MTISRLGIIAGPEGLPIISRGGALNPERDSTAAAAALWGKSG